MVGQDTLITERALRNLEANTGIKGIWIPQPVNAKDNGLDGKLTLVLDKQKFTFDVEVKRELRQYHFERLLTQANNNRPLMVIADQIFPTLKQRLKDEGIAYIDGAGNIYLRREGQVIWIEGQKAPVGQIHTRNRIFTKAGLKVIHALLEWPEAINRPYREIASLANVALGTVNVVMAGLKDNGYLLQLNEKTIALKKKKELLEKWIEGYRTILKPAMLLGTYYAREGNWRTMELPNGAVWGGEPAADKLTNYLDPEVLTIYTAGTKNELTKKMLLAPKIDGNVTVYQMFWNPVLNEKTPEIAPYLVVYADLLITDEPRCVETAEIIYNKHLKTLFE